MTEHKEYRVYTLTNFQQIPQVNNCLTQDQINAIRIVGNVLPFKVNNYVIDELIDWNNIPDDPIFQLTFPSKEMLSDRNYDEMERALNADLSKTQLRKVAEKIRKRLNPNPDGQEMNVPILNGQKLEGIQHKYKETLLFFPSNSQTCHAYCTFCFRWPQFVEIDEHKFAMKETDLLIKYLKAHPEVTNILITGGDPMVMSAKKLEEYIGPLLSANLPNIQTIRIGTKSLTYWPYRFISDNDSDDLLKLFEKVGQHGLRLAFMAHFNHPKELQTRAVQAAIKRILGTGAVIRTQSPVLKNINDNAEDWKTMWKLQVKLGCIPYYMFITRDTGAQKYFAVTLEKAWKIYQKAHNLVSGLARTARGPIISADPGKVEILGTSEVNGEKAFVLRFLQGRNPDWACKPFFAEFDPEAIWLSDLKPFSDMEHFFFEEEMNMALYEMN